MPSASQRAFPTNYPRIGDRVSKPEDSDLNQIITSAVNARVEAAVAQALAGDEVIGRLVTAALQQQIEVPSSSGYGKDRVVFMTHVVRTAVREATKSAVQKFLAEETETIEAEVRKHLRRAAPEIAANMVGKLTEVASKGYGIKVSLRTGTED